MSTGTAPGSELAPDPAARLRASASALSCTPDGDEVLIGNPRTGMFVAVPEVGRVVVQTLAAGGTVADAATAAEQVAGEPVDVPDFLAALRDAGVLDDTEPPVITRPPGRLSSAAARIAPPLFGRLAWTVYAAAAVFDLAVLIARPVSRPTVEDAWFLTDPLLSIACLGAIALVLPPVHEAWHWLAGRAAGVPGTFRISFRGIFITYETDLSLLLTVPRRQRYGPMLAGLAFDGTVIAASLGLRWLYEAGAAQLPPGLYRLLGAIVVFELFAVALQCAVFLRTDLYAVLATALGCQNLYRISWLTLKRRLLPLTGPERAELAEATDRDRAVAGWFSLLYFAGALGMLWFLVSYLLPFGIGTVAWLLPNLAAGGVDQSAFWESATVTALIAAQFLLPAALAVRERRQRARGRLR